MTSKQAVALTPSASGTAFQDYQLESTSMLYDPLKPVHSSNAATLFLTLDRTSGTLVIQHDKTRVVDADIMQVTGLTQPTISQRWVELMNAIVY